MDGKKMIMIFFWVLPVLFSVPASGFTVGGEISFTKTGDLFIQLVTEEEFKNDRMPPFALILRVGPEEIKKGKVSFQFGGVPAGPYGIRCFQDVNGNQKLDWGTFGLREPWGVYRPHRPVFRGPKFEEISFVIVFLDIRMPGLTGVEVARKIAGSCQVVFVTAYDEYAVEAFEKGAVDYLVKPVTRERLEKTVKRLQEQIAVSSKTSSEAAEIMERLLAGLAERKAPSYLRWVRVQHKDGVRLIPVEEVCYFQASDKYTLVRTKASDSLIHKTIKELVDELDPDQFWQIHRGTIVNASCVAQVGRSLTGRGVVRLKDRPETLTVSHRYMHVFKQM